MRDYAPIVKDMVKALAWATVGVFVLTMCVIALMWLYHLVFDFNHLGEFNAKITGRAVYADSATQRLQKLGSEKTKQIDEMKKQLTK